MSSLAGATRGQLTALAVLGAAVLLTASSAVTGRDTSRAVPAMLCVVLVTVLARRTISWRAMLASIVLVILFVPMKKYSLPASLPINLELYRLIVALVAAVWLASCLIDRRVRVRSNGVVDRPFVAVLLVIVLSELVNPARVSSVGSDLVKALLFFASYAVVMYMVASLVRTREDLDFIVTVLVRGGAVVAVFALVESRTSYNVFDHLHRIFPFLMYSGADESFIRGSHLRVFGSSQHPIAMGAAFTMLVPLALYRAFALRRKAAWLLAFLLVIGAMVTVSRTAMIMVVVVLVVFAVVRPRQVRRMWPALLPAVLVVHIAAPGLIGSVHASFFPKGGIVAQQTNDAVGSGRLATMWPAIHTEFTPNPVLGEGFGTRVTAPDDVVKVPNAPILDDEWLGVLLETGLAGAAAFLWFFARFVRRLVREARGDPSSRGWFLGAIAASVAAYGVSMFFYDAFSFIQVTFLLFILIGLGGVAYRLPRGFAHGA